MTSMRIAPFPELTAYAEEEARALYEARHTGRRLEWADLATEWREHEIAAHLALLTDLSRRSPYDAVLRLAASKMRIKVYALHALIAGAIPYPPEWSPDLCDKVATADTEAEALAAIVAALWGGS